MDNERIKKRQFFRVIIAETVMVIAVIAIVTVLALIVMGYRISPDFVVERAGLLQISSVPTGATVEIDGNTLLSRTNFSRTMSSGVHLVTISKNGYDTWTKEVEVGKGTLYKVHYPRLFPTERQSETVRGYDLVTSASFSPDHNGLLLMNESTVWEYVDLASENATATKLDVDDLFSCATLSTTTLAGSFNCQIFSIDWSKSGSRVLMGVLDRHGAKEWAVLDIRDISNSVNLTKNMKMDFSNLIIKDDNADYILALENGNLREVGVYAGEVSKVLLENIISLDHKNGDIIYVMDNLDSTKSVGLYKHWGSGVSVIYTTAAQSSLMATVSQHYDQDYVTIVDNNKLMVYEGKLPSRAGAAFKMNLIIDAELSFAPSSIKVGHEGEFVVMQNGVSMAVFDAEALDYGEYQVANSNVRWIDNDMIYVVQDGTLTVYDYDGLNRREIEHDVYADFGAAITNDEWLYYFDLEKNLVREKIN